MCATHADRHSRRVGIVAAALLMLALVPAPADETESTNEAVQPVQPAQPDQPTTVTEWTRRGHPPTADAWLQHEGWVENVALVYGKAHDILGDHLHVGVRRMKFNFTENMSRVGMGSENYFLGSIDELVDVQDTGWGEITVGLYLNRNVGIEYRHDEVRARTYTAADNNHSDGDFVVEGSIFSAVLRLPLDQVLQGAHTAFNWPPESEGRAYDLLARLVPYVGVGVETLSGSFEAATWWGHGYSSPDSWESLGSSPTIIRNSHTRNLVVSDQDVGRYILYGIAVRVIDSLYFDVSWSSVDVDLTVDYYLDRRYQLTRSFPMSYETTSLGIRYFF